MPSKHMLPKGKRRQSVRAQYRAARDAASESVEEKPVAEEESPSGTKDRAEKRAPRHGGEGPGAKAPLTAQPLFRGLKAPAPSGKAKADISPACEGAPLSPVSFSAGGVRRSFIVSGSDVGMRLDAFLAQAIPDISRARAQLLIDAGQVRVGSAAAKASHKVRAGETVTVEGEPRPEPLHATPEDIPLEILYEDQYLAVINKPAGMMVHAGAGSSDETRSRGTLVNALLHHMGKLSQAGGDLRPGIVHRLDKETSGAIAVAKDDVTHRKLSEMFSSRRVQKMYIALVHGSVSKNDVTVDLPIARDLVRRTRMTTRRTEGRHAVSHVHVLERLTTPYGAFTLIEVRIETGRTHQIRVHMQALGNPVVGDTMYGAPRALSRSRSNARLNDSAAGAGEDVPRLDRNFLHAAHLEFAHPRTAKAVSVDAPLPGELQRFLSWVRSESKAGHAGRKDTAVG